MTSKPTAQQALHQDAPAQQASGGVPGDAPGPKPPTAAAPSGGSLVKGKAWRDVVAPPAAGGGVPPAGKGERVAREARARATHTDMLWKEFQVPGGVCALSRCLVRSYKAIHERVGTALEQGRAVSDGCVRRRHSRILYFLRHVLPDSHICHGRTVPIVSKRVHCLPSMDMHRKILSAIAPAAAACRSPPTVLSRNPPSNLSCLRSLTSVQPTATANRRQARVPLAPAPITSALQAA